MTVQQLDHLNLTVDDFDTTVAWYGRLFGFELVEKGGKRSTKPPMARRSAPIPSCSWTHPPRASRSRYSLACLNAAGVLPMAVWPSGFRRVPRRSNAQVM